MENKHSLVSDIRRFFAHVSSHLGRRGVFVLFLILFLSSSALAGWKTRFFSRIYWQYNQAQIAVVVSDEKDGRPLTDIEVKVNGKSGKTDGEGKVSFTLEAGEWEFLVSMPGFKDFSQTLRLKRGKNADLLFSLGLATTSVRGRVLDFVDGQPLEGVEISVGGVSAISDVEGKFALEEVVIGTPPFNAGKEGYYDFSQTLTLEKDKALNLGDLEFLAKGKVIFVSNRDGKNAVYSAKLDGGEVQKVWDNKGFNDTSPFLSPDGKHAIFLSDRDGKKGPYGDPINLLYYVSLGGGDPVRISTDEYIAADGWLKDNTGFVFHFSVYDETTYETTEFVKIVKIPSLEIINLESQTGDSLWMGAVEVSPQGGWIAYALSDYYQPDRQGIYLVQADGTGKKRVSPRDYAENLFFSEDGENLYYSTWEGSGLEYFSYDLTAGTETKIPELPIQGRCVFGEGGGYCENLVVYSSSQDLKAFVDFRDGKNDIYVSKKDGSGEKRITFSGGVESLFFAGPNGKYLLYSVSLPQENSAYVVGLGEGAKPKKVSDINLYLGGFVPQ